LLWRRIAESLKAGEFVVEYQRVSIASPHVEIE